MFRWFLVVTPKKEESMNNTWFLCKLDWSSWQIVIIRVPTASGNQHGLSPWAPRYRADFCEKCTRVLRLTKFCRSGVPNFVKMSRGVRQFLTWIYGFLWGLNFRFNLVSISVPGLIKLMKIRLKLITAGVPVDHQPKRKSWSPTEIDR